MGQKRHYGFFVCMASLCFATGFAAALWTMSAKGITKNNNVNQQNKEHAALVEKATQTAARIPPAGLSSGAPSAPTDRAPPQKIFRYDIGTPQVASGPAFPAGAAHTTQETPIWVKGSDGKLHVDHKAKKGEQLSVITQVYPNTKGGYTTRVLPLDDYIKGMQGYQDGLRSLNVQNASAFAVVLVPSKDGSTIFGLVPLKACALNGAEAQQKHKVESAPELKTKTPAAGRGYVSGARPAAGRGYVSGARPAGGDGSRNPLGYIDRGGPRGAW